MKSEPPPFCRLRRFAIFGGSFNPIHEGHLAMARQARALLKLERVILIPAFLSPHKRENEEMAPPADRLAMCRAAIRGRSGLSVWDGEIKRGVVSYTIDTVRRFRKFYGAKARIFFLIGADNLADLHSWRSIRQILRLAEPVVLSRNRHPLSQETWRRLEKRLGRRAASRLRAGIIPIEKSDVSASKIRRRIRRGQSVRGMTPEVVRTYAIKHGLYGARE